jgi:hypothetical protein
MCICKFCNNPFTPRPQVKNPQACSKQECQKARQQSNEKDWHSRNRGLYDKEYHRQQKLQRIKVIREVKDKILNCARVGAKFLGESFRWEHFKELFERIFLRLGIKVVNKL